MVKDWLVRYFGWKTNYNHLAFVERRNRKDWLLVEVDRERLQFGSILPKEGTYLSRIVEIPIPRALTALSPVPNGASCALVATMLSAIVSDRESQDHASRQ